MDLFVVNRYLGEDAIEEEEGERAGREERILAKLHAEAQKKKKLKYVKTGICHTVSGVEVPVNEISQSKKHKKRKVRPESISNDGANNEMSGNVNNDTSVGEASEVKSSHINKRVKLDDSVTVDKTEVCNYLTENITTPAKTMKKKKIKNVVEGDLKSSAIGEVTHMTKEECHVKKKKKKKDRLEPHAGGSQNIGLDAGLLEKSAEMGTEVENNESLGDVGTNTGREMANVESKEELFVKKNESNEVGGFTVLGEVTAQKRTRVKNILPHWLSHPCVFSADLKHDQEAVSDITGLDSVFVEKLKNDGISQFFPVQHKVIPWLLDSFTNCHYRPSDICVCAPTGSGKTLVFVLPILQTLKTRVITQIRALVVLPGQDLAMQVYEVFQKYCIGTKLKVALLTGHNSFSDEQDTLIRKGIRGYHSLVDVVVATPGRLVDHIQKTAGFSLRYLRFLVLDEADRFMDTECDWLKLVEKSVYMTDEIGEFERQIPGLITATNVQKLKIPLQKLLFSATLSQDPEKLQQISLFQPKLFTAAATANSLMQKWRKIGTENKETTPITDNKVEAEVTEKFIETYTTPGELDESFVVCDLLIKPLILYHLITTHGWKHILCFTNSKENTHRLCILMKQLGGLKIGELSSNLRPAVRTRQLRHFETGKIDMLVCTDSLARGMDIPSVRYVVSYNLPKFVKGYIHRVGRTARAGREGTAITMVQRHEVWMLRKMIQDARKTPLTQIRVNTEELEPLEEKYKIALAELKRTLKEEKRKLQAKVSKTYRQNLKILSKDKRKQKGTVLKKV